jgi:hypothetical protein
MDNVIDIRLLRVLQICYAAVSIRSMVSTLRNKGGVDDTSGEFVSSAP